MKRPAIFLDRDGTLIEEVNFLSRVEDLRLFPFTAEAVRLFKDKGYLVIVVIVSHPRDPLHGITLETIIKELVEGYGWAEMGGVSRSAVSSTTPA